MYITSHILYILSPFFTYNSRVFLNKFKEFIIPSDWGVGGGVVNGAVRYVV